jgi:hypothetical protein
VDAKRSFRDSDLPNGVFVLKRIAPLDKPPRRTYRSSSFQNEQRKIQLDDRISIRVTVHLCAPADPPHTDPCARPFILIPRSARP